jgi:hypothetical protein
MSMARIFVLAGQSNMVGAGETGELPDSLRSFPQNVRLFEDGVFRDVLWRERFGPEAGFASRIGSIFPREPIVLCKMARGGANLYYDWNPDGCSRGEEDTYRGPLYPKLQEEIARLVSALEAEGRDHEFTAVLWMQGERDSVFSVMAEAYEENLRNFIDAIRWDLGVSELPFLIGQIAPRQYDLMEGTFRHSCRKTVQKAQRAVARSQAGVALTGIDGSAAERQPPFRHGRANGVGGPVR